MIRRDPATAFRFRVFFDGMPVFGFSKVGGIRLTRELDDIQEGGNNYKYHNKLKAVKRANISLERGIVDPLLFHWFNGEEGQFADPRNMTIAVLDEGGLTPSVLMHFLDCVPVSWQGPPLDAMSGTIAVEKIELSYDVFTWLR
jgi:phage tail-like protein